jgi:hypothetical protein
MLKMDWDPKGEYVPPSDVKRNHTSTLQAKYKKISDEEVGAVFAFLPILLWRKFVFESNTQVAEKLRAKTNPMTLDKLFHFIGVLMHIWSMSSM